MNSFRKGFMPLLNATIGKPMPITSQDKRRVGNFKNQGAKNARKGRNYEVLQYLCKWVQGKDVPDIPSLPAPCVHIHECVGAGLRNGMENR